MIIQINRSFKDKTACNRNCLSNVDIGKSLAKLKGDNIKLF